VAFDRRATPPTNEASFHLHIKMIDDGRRPCDPSEGPHGGFDPEKINVDEQRHI
jgi:hypothetical protein